MTFLSIGDLAQNFSLRSQNAEIKARLQRLGQELGSGETADPATRFRGDLRPVAAIERSLVLMDAYDLAASEAVIAGDAMQTALAQLTDAAQTAGSQLIQTASLPNTTLSTAAGNEARQWLEQTVSALNTRVGGRTLFAGAATDGPALAGAGELLAALEAEVAGLTTAEDVVAAVDDWFARSDGFETVAYLGADHPTGAVRVTEGRTVNLDTTASDPEIRDLLKALATGALLSDANVLSGNHAARSELSRAAGEALLSAESRVTDLRAGLGSVQARIETIQTENAASRNALELARSDLLSVDPYETATEFQAVEGQLETFYAVTARLSRLSLADYLT